MPDDQRYPGLFQKTGTQTARLAQPGPTAVSPHTAPADPSKSSDLIASRRRADRKPNILSPTSQNHDSLTDNKNPKPAGSVLLTGPALKVTRLTEKLRDVIAEETKLLEARLPRKAQELHGEKARLIVEYREALGALKQNDRVLGEKDSKERAHVKAITDTLRDALKDHARIVLRLKSVAEGLVRSVGEEVNKRSKLFVGYGANASMGSNKMIGPTSLAFNQVI